MAAQTARIAKTLDGRTVSVSEIYNLARTLERAYAKAGYVLVRVTVPPQALADDSRVRLFVVNGFIEGIDLAGVPVRIRRHIAHLLRALIGVQGLKYNQLERRLLLAADQPGVRLRSALVSGSAPGAAILAVQAEYHPIAVTLGVDNSMSADLGRAYETGGLDLNSTLGLGELIYVRATGDYGATGRSGYTDRLPRDRALALGGVVALGDDGLALNLEAADSRATPRKMDGVLGVTSVFDRFSAKLRYPLIRSRVFGLNGEVQFDVESDALYTAQSPQVAISLDRLRVLRISADGWWTAPTGAFLTARATLSNGIDSLGARDAADAAASAVGLSRQGTNASFEKFEVRFTAHQDFAPHLTLDVSAMGQLSSRALANAEQIGLVAPSGLSGFDTGAFEGDEGYVARAEMVSPWTVAGRWNQLGVAPYVFAATGRDHELKPTVLESADTTASLYGVGARLYLTSSHINLGDNVFTVEWAKQALGDRGPSKNRVSLSLTSRF